MLRKILTCFFLFAGFFNTIAQNITAKVVDSETGEVLPNAGVIINDTENVICNSEGYFTVPDKYNDDHTLLYVTFLGYAGNRVSLGELKNNNLIVKLKAGAFEIDELYISNKAMSVNADSIMVSVKKNLSKNYRYSGKPNQKMIFYREGLAFKPIKLKAEMTDASNYSKQQLKEANTEINIFVNQLISHPPQEFTDMLSNYYTATKIHKEKPYPVSKFKMIKAVQIKDRSRSVDLNEMEKMASGVLFKHLDKSKLYRVKSGIVGTRDTVVANGAFYESRKYPVEKNKLNIASNKVTSFMGRNGLMGSRFDFLSLHERYEYSFHGTTQTGNNESVFIIKFKPKKRKGKYTGTLYVSEKDYAVIRTDYALAEGKILGGVNLKFLFGIKQSENVSRGTIIFKERSSGDGYYLQYASVEDGQYIYVNRPLKFLEIAEDDKHFVAFDLKVEANVIEKEELFVLSESDIAESEYDKVKSEDFDYIQLDSYNPGIWKEYITIEPLEEMKQFRTAE